MAADEQSRQELYRKAEEVLGARAAIALMEFLPPVGWADVATKHDLAGLEGRMDVRFTGFEQRLDLRFTRIDERFAGLEQQMDESIRAWASDLRAGFEHELRAQTMTMMFGLVGVVLTMAALAFALARFPSP